MLEFLGAFPRKGVHRLHMVQAHQLAQQGLALLAGAVQQPAEFALRQQHAAREGSKV